MGATVDMCRARLVPRAIRRVLGMSDRVAVANNIVNNLCDQFEDSQSKQEAMMASDNAVIILCSERVI